MRLLTYAADVGSPRAGVLDASGLVWDAETLAEAAGFSSSAACSARSVRGLLELGRQALPALARAASSGPRAAAREAESVHIGPPVPNPEKIICLGLNYRDHAEETGFKVPTTPTVFAKYANSLIGPFDDIVIPSLSSQVDYEGELAVVIGETCRHVGEGEALEFVAGAMALNDVSARDLQMETSQWTLGKAIDTFAPCGPQLVLRDELDDLQALSVVTRLNGRTVQASSTAHMVFGVAVTVSFLSRLMTLVPGDIIATGTPAGVGMAHDPPIWLAVDDVVEVDVAGVGVLGNRVVASGKPTDRPKAMAP
jgi:2-keto-4-pentenoate hydratase/2-oxohepta-3-ene-1,7-dioic acid hydratase in catechol pathway